jgi:hypothetical protein
MRAGCDRDACRLQFRRRLGWRAPVDQRAGCDHDCAGRARVVDPRSQSDESGARDVGPAYVAADQPTDDRRDTDDEPAHDDSTDESADDRSRRDRPASREQHDDTDEHDHDDRSD